MSNQVWNLFLRASRFLGIFTVDHEVKARQQRRLWTISKKFTNVAVGATINVILDAKSFDMNYIIALKTSGSCDYNTYLNPVYTGGTPLNVFNRVTGHTDIFENRVLIDANITTKGIQRADDAIIGATTGAVKLGGSQGDSIYTELSKGTSILLEIVNTSNQPQPIIQIVGNLFDPNVSEV